MKNKTTRTPGPWDFRIVPSSNPPKVAVSDRSDRNEHVALCYGSEHDALANARLIAAAPDLLEAAKTGLLALLEITQQSDEWPRVIAKLRAAIAKAEGC